MFNLNDMQFKNPEAFYLLIVPALLILWHIWRYSRYFPSIKLSNLNYLNTKGRPLRAYIKSALPALRILAMVCLILAIARPQSTLKKENISTEGIDITIIMDVSTSMLAKDFKPNRLDASKEVASDFISNRPDDRVGLVVFAGESFTQCPITTDHSVVQKQLKEISNGFIEDGTAIGMGLATSVSRLKDSKAISKVAILLTDGVNNSGFIDPLTAAETAIQFGVRVYTIGVGSKGKALSPVRQWSDGRLEYDYIDVEIDEALLQDIAQQTGGQYFRATDKEALIEIYNEIDQLEKTKIKTASFTKKSEEFFPFAALAGLLIFFELLLKYMLLRSIP
ncbi:MAG: VWA domain-containing protein [Chitinophagales bacterium]|nr:VWA domain-containing protein [Chitinophagales bacterium]